MRKGCFRIFCALALLLAVAAPAALAGTISGSGWFDTDYTGS